MTKARKTSKLYGWLTAAILLLCIAFSSCAAETAEDLPAAEPAEWTVLFYMCGSDLETRYSYGSGNLAEIAGCEYPNSIFKKYAEAEHIDYEQVTEKADELGIQLSERTLSKNPVNVLVETGGCREWHAGDLGMDIDSGSLQRWRYHLPNNPDGEAPGYTLEQTLPLASMASPETLTDYIRWGAQTYPAKKYMLVLWGHGGGSKTGIFTDELFGGDIMILDELGQALRDSGVQLEAVLFDACMMANMETAWMIHDSARWMIASEEVVPGYGTDIRGWLQELINNSGADGKQLGRCVCDMTQIKYADMGDAQAQRILTWSVIDLSRIERVIRGTEQFMKVFFQACVEYPDLAARYAHFINDSERYTLGNSGMRDLSSVLYSADAVKAMDVALRNEMIDALSEAVVYSLRGAGRSRSRGLSFCYAFQFTPEELEVFARNCTNVYYLALLDAISADWQAPDWVHEQLGPVKPLYSMEVFRPVLEKRRRSNGMPGLFASRENMNSVMDVKYRLYRLNEDTEQVECLGTNICRGIETEDGVLWSAIAPGYWWAVEDVICSVDVVSATDNQCVYNIPIRINNEHWYLRCLREYTRYLTEETADAEALSVNTIYGLWEGYDDQSSSFGRNILPLPEMAGREFSLLYPVPDASEDGHTFYAASEKQILGRALDVAEKPLPAGTYYLEYETEDVLFRTAVLERIEMYWDGTAWSYPEGFTWEGELIPGDNGGSND